MDTSRENDPDLSGERSSSVFTPSSNKSGPNLHRGKLLFIISADLTSDERRTTNINNVCLKLICKTFKPPEKDLCFDVALLFRVML